MTPDEYNGVTFNDLDSSGTRISKSSECSVVNSTQIALNIPHKDKAHINFMNLETLQTL